MPERTGKAFVLSYGRDDATAARWIAEALRSAGRSAGRGSAKTSG